MDDLDLAIIRVLGENPRVTNKAIALALDVSEPTVAARIRSLHNDNVIRITGRRNAREDRENSLLAIAECFLEDSSKIAEVGAAFSNFDDVLVAYETSRRPELILIIRAANPRMLNETIMTLASQVPNLAQLNTLPILDIRRYHTSLMNLERLPPPRPKPQDVGEALIALLEEDGRQSIRSLGRQLGLSETAVRHRMSRLLKETSMEIVLVCDAAAMGYHVWTDIRVTVAPAKLKAAMDSLAEQENVIVVAHLAGQHNLQIFLTCRSVEDLDSFVSNHVRSLPGLVDFAMMRVPNVVKYNYHYIL